MYNNMYTSDLAGDIIFVKCGMLNDSGVVLSGLGN